MSNTNIPGAVTGTIDPTYVVRISSKGPLDPVQVAQVLAPVNEGYGCTVERAVGVWDNEVEQAVTITAQATEYAIEKWLVALAGHFPELRWVHVERHTPDIDYVDLDVLGAHYGNR